MDAKIQNQSVGNDDTNFEVLIDSRRESDYLEMLRKLKLELADKSSECEMFKIKLDQSTRDLRNLKCELNECKLTVFQNGEDANKTHEESQKSKKLEEDYVNLMNDYLNLSEQCEQYRQNIYDNYLAKTNAINNYECFMSSKNLSSQLDDCRLSLSKKSAEINLTTAKLRNLEEANSVKDKCIKELRKTLDDAKVTHKHEINVLGEYIECLKNTINSYEKTLTGSMDEQTGMSKVNEDQEAPKTSEEAREVEATDLLPS